MAAPPRSLAGALLLAVVLALLSPVAPAEASSRYLCNGYVGCQKSGHPHHGYRQANDQMWWRMYRGHNCTNYVAYRLVRQGMSADRPWNGSGMAYNWGRANRRITDQTPMVGSVAWWNAGDGVGSSGHVAYVEKVISRRRIVISEDSWGGDFHWREIRRRGGGWPTGFIHFDDREVRAVEPPVVTGTPAVGSPLTLDPGSWSPAASLDVQWLAAGQPIEGATGTSFTPTPTQRRKRLSVRVTATARGHLPGAATTAATRGIRKGRMTVVAPPSLSGTARVDEVLTLSPGSVTPAAERTGIRWYADGTRIAGAAGPRLRLGQDLIRKQITATVVSRRAGYWARGSTSAATAAVQAGRFRITEPFRLTGRAHLGRRLTVEPGRFEPADGEVSYTWLRDGQAIAGAAGPTYVVGVDDVGHRVSVRVDLKHTGYRNASRSLGSERPVTTSPRLRVRAVGRRHAAVVRVRVRAPGVAPPGGRATVRVGKRRVTGDVVDGRLRVVIRRLPRGRHQVQVRYRGTEVVRPARSTTRVRIPRR